MTNGERAFAWGFRLAAVGSAAGGILLWLGVVAFEGGPQTGRSHALPASLAMLSLRSA